MNQFGARRAPCALQPPRLSGRWTQKQRKGAEGELGKEIFERQFKTKLSAGCALTIRFLPDDVNVWQTDKRKRSAGGNAQAGHGCMRYGESDEPANKSSASAPVPGAQRVRGSEAGKRTFTGQILSYAATQCR